MERRLTDGDASGTTATAASRMTGAGVTRGVMKMILTGGELIGLRRRVRLFPIGAPG